jgi:hypothetical protein
MAITVTWSVEDMTRDSATGGVKTIYWQCVAMDDTHNDCVATEGGKYKCEPDASADSFIAYDDLTEAVVLEWVKASEDVDADAIEANRTAKVEAQVARKTSDASGTPWVQEVVQPEFSTPDPE